MKKIKYHVYICVENKQKVCFAYCECPIGLAQSCSHIGGLLFYIHHLQLSEKLMSDSATSKSCQWNVPRPMKMEPKPLKDWNLSRPKLSSEGQVEFREKKQIDFDPRHPDQREFQLAHSIEQLKILKEIFPKTGMCHLWMIPDETPEVVKEVEVQTSEDPMEMAMKALILSKENLPMAISIDENLSLFIEERTQGQRCCPIWRELHKGRITSSLFGAVLGSGANPNSLVDQIIKGSGLDRYQSLPKAIQWGIDHEKEALQDYLCLQNCVTNLTVEPSGLTIYPSHAFLGASSDGWIYDKSMPVGNQKGVLEIKCPYSISNEVITDREVHELAGQGGFCLEMTDEGPRLKRSHKYYAQIQGEMAIMGCSWGDFVVWTAASQSNCFIERVYFDVTFVTSMMPKLVEFFVSYISPSYTK
ncbi:uncharacterized protein LOC133176992 [Saccostrea echinata]|uniref:uncharacterized protein LOC133176992 n=1 Tax=Saccostrea echinata TaxID=191078 RepID=UPI002A816B73|nr:uncharacterized protein LOC133176992 [Saccostrea echinata]